MVHNGVQPSLHIDYEHSKIKQYHKLNRALRTETTINDTRDFGIGKRLHNLPALREVGFLANRGLLATQRISRDPPRGDDVYDQACRPKPSATNGSPGCAWMRSGRRCCCRHWSCSACCPTGSPP